MRITLDIDRELERQLHLAADLEALDSGSRPSIEAMILEAVLAFARGAEHDAILSDDGRVVGDRGRIQSEAMEIAMLGGDFRSTYSALVEALRMSAT